SSPGANTIATLRRSRGIDVETRWHLRESKLDVTAGCDTAPRTPEVKAPFCVALMGDFSGRANRGICEPGTIANRQPVLIDRDNFDEVLAKFHPEIKLPIGSQGDLLCLRFSELEDFHPDRLFERLEIFRSLRDERARIQN